MNSKSRFLRAVLACMLTVVLLTPTAAVQAEIMTSEGLDQTLAPIALYPDALLGNVLVGSTYPDQVVEAQQWAQAHPGTSQEGLDSALSGYSWDPSVKALVAAPDVLNMMAGDMDWTVRLGNAFVDQTDDVYDSIQRLRAQAQSTGALQSNEQVEVVTDDSGYVLIGSANPNYVYVPTYEPAVVYGWNPGQVVATTALVWGTTAILNSIFYGSCWNWGARSMYFGPGYGTCGYWGGGVNVWGGGRNVNINNNININRIQNNIGNNINSGHQNWKPGKPGSGGRWDGNNGWNRPGGGDRPGSGNRPGAGNRPGQGDRPGSGNRPGAGNRPGSGQQPSTRPATGQRPSFDPSRVGGRPSTGQRPSTRPSTGQRPSTRPSTGQRPSTRPSQQPAFQRPSSGGNARQAGNRGRQSRSSSPSVGGGGGRSRPSGGARSGGGGGGGRSGGGGGGRSGGGGGRGGRR